jgi:hypothetical protein
MSASAEGATGVADPIATTPPRRPGSVRRTSHIDIARDDEGGLVLSGAARDLCTSAIGTEVVALAEVRATLDYLHTLLGLQTTPAEPGSAELVGAHVGSGFRAAVDAALPEHREQSTPLYVLLDELPVAALISGYALLYRGDLTRDRMDAGQVKGDICSGWRSDGTMMVSLRTKGSMPIPYGPPANQLERADDPLSWHEIGVLPTGAMRRRRLVELTDGAPVAVYAMFRDTHVGPDGAETILHEYAVTATLDRETLELTHAAAEPHVLPWIECPAAAASASRLDGHSVRELRRFVGREFRGTSTCTHLNDLLRSLADLSALLALLPQR